MKSNYWYSIIDDTKDKDYHAGSASLKTALEMARSSNCELVAVIDITTNNIVDIYEVNDFLM